jgi:hypothetical protein
MYLLYLLMTYILSERKKCTKDTFCKCIMRILRIRRVVLQVLHVPWCHACMLEMHTKITFSRPATAFTSFRPVNTIAMMIRGWAPISDLPGHGHYVFNRIMLAPWSMA